MDERNSCVGLWFVRFSCGLPGWFSCVQHPVAILYVSLMSVPPELWTVNYRTGNRVPKTSTACAFCVRSTNVLSISYTVHIRFVRYTSVTCTWIDRTLSITCAIRMRSLRLLGQPSPRPKRLPSPDKYFLPFFCPFGIRYLYPLCDSTIMWATILLVHGPGGVTMHPLRTLWSGIILLIGPLDLESRC